MRKLNTTYEEAGLKVNFEKTKHLVISGNEEDLTVDGNVIESCNSYKYLGALISSEGRSRQEINNRIILARQATNKLNSIFWSDEIIKKTKKEFMRR